MKCVSLVKSEAYEYLQAIFFVFLNRMLQCEGITKRFGDFTALDNLSLQVPDGKIYGLLGPNGAGKTTLIRIVNRMLVPTSGKVYFNGSLMDDRMVRSIGYLPEERGLFRKMKVIDQVVYLARLKGMTTADAVGQFRQWSLKFGMQGWWDKKVEDLSKGMAQKVQFVTTVLHRPKLVVLDEPFSGFDPLNAQLIRDEIIRLKDEGTTIILSTHNMASVEEMCDEIALIDKSRLVVAGAVDEIRRRYGDNKASLIYSDEEGLHTEILDVDGSTSLRIRSLLENGAILKSYTEIVPGMKDIFIKLVGGSKEESK